MGYILGCAYSKPWTCAWMVAEWVSLGNGTTLVNSSYTPFILERREMIKSHELLNNCQEGHTEGK